MQPERFAARPCDQDDAILALRNRDIDAMFVMRAPGNPRLKWLAGAAQIEIVEIDQTAAMQVKRPSPQTAFSSPATRCLKMLCAAPRPPCSKTSANSRLSSRLAGFVSQPQLSGATLLPVHPGAVAFYNRDQPSFFPENAEPVDVTVSVAAILATLLLWAKRRWEEGQKGRIDV